MGQKVSTVSHKGKGGGVGEAMRTGGTRGRGLLIVLLGDEWSDEKNKNREGDGASDFDGSCWMGGCNNQPKSGPIVRIYLGETERRAMAIGEDSMKSFWPLDLGQKNKKSEIHRGFRRPPIDNFTQQPTKSTRDRWGKNRRGRATVGERRGGAI